MIDDESTRDDVDPEVQPEADDGASFEPDEEMGDLATAQTKMKKLRDQLKEAQTKRDEYLAGWQRCKADSVNARKDALVHAERAAEREKDSFIEDILPVLDSFDMASTSQAWASVDDEWRTGIGHIQNQLLNILEKHGVKRFGKVGEKFDPRMHEAAQEVEDGDGESHTILKVLRHGYRSGEKILRAAHVIVRK